MNVEPQDATAAKFETPGGRRLRDLVNSDQEARAAMFAFARECFDEYQNEIGSQQPLPRQPTHLVEEFSRADRDAERESLLDQMLNADGLRRQLLIVRARDLHSGAERRHLRGRAVRRLHRLYYGDLSERSAARLILYDLRRRTGETCISTGERGKDRLCDEIIASARTFSDRTIRSDLAPPEAGQNL